MASEILILKNACFASNIKSLQLNGMSFVSTVQSMQINSCSFSSTVKSMQLSSVGFGIRKAIESKLFYQKNNVTNNK